MEKDEEFTNSSSHYDFGARIYDSRLGRFLSVDPLMMTYPEHSTYITSANNPINYIDSEGESPQWWGYTAWSGLTRAKLKKLAQKSGFWIRRKPGESIESYNRRYNTALGRVFEKNVLRAMRVPANTSRKYPYKTNNKYTVPDAVMPSGQDDIENSKSWPYWPVTVKSTTWKEGTFIEIKASQFIAFEPKFNPEQFKKQIDYLSQVEDVTVWERDKGVRNAKKNAAENGFAVLVIVTVSDAKIDKALIKYATDNKVMLIQHKVMYRENSDDTPGDFDDAEIKLDKGKLINPEVLKKHKYDKSHGVGDRSMGTSTEFEVEQKYK